MYQLERQQYYTISQIKTKERHPTNETLCLNIGAVRLDRSSNDSWLRDLERSALGTYCLRVVRLPSLLEHALICLLWVQGTGSGYRGLQTYFSRLGGEWRYSYRGRVLTITKLCNLSASFRFRVWHLSRPRVSLPILQFQLQLQGPILIGIEHVLLVPTCSAHSYI